MNAAQKQELKEAAEQAQRVITRMRELGCGDTLAANEIVKFKKLSTPAAILELLAEIERLEKRYQEMVDIRHGEGGSGDTEMSPAERDQALGGLAKTLLRVVKSHKGIKDGAVELVSKDEVFIAVYARCALGCYTVSREAESHEQCPTCGTERISNER